MSDKTNDQWKETLTPEQYHVLREKGTERAFSGEYDQHFEDGVYTCAGCGEKLFDSTHKYDAGCGWPSFDRVAAPDAVDETEDNSFLMNRTEVLCHKCGGHLGHVFADGPQETTGQRYCINSAALQFQSRGGNNNEVK